MLPTNRNQYLALRLQFSPEIMRLIFIAESPPASGRYFYNPAGTIGEPLFAAMMKHLGLSPTKKEEGLLEFQRNGWFLVDATYQPVNELDSPGRDRVIAEHYPLLRDDLRALTSGRTVPLVLIKANVCRLLESKLADDGFNVINRGRIIYFPSNGRQTEFHRQLRAVLGSDNIT